MPSCRIHEEQGFIECQREAWERDPDGLCLLHSRKEDKNQTGKFTDAIKEQLSAEDYNFRGVFFPGPVDFKGQKFTKKADFSMTIFIGEADFTETTFSEGANFFRPTFLKGVIFNQATFLGWSEFYRAIFSDWTLFLGVTISASGRVLFLSVNTPDEKNRRLPFRANFRFLQQEHGGRLIFQDLSLSLVEFTDTDLRQVEFDQVTWASWWGRAAVYDEIVLHQKWFRSFHKRGIVWWDVWGIEYQPKLFERLQKLSFYRFAPVERLYRQLKINYEEERDFKRVGDFHYGEMEMHRRGSFWRQWVPFSWHNLYRVLSGYGERPLRAFIWLLLLIPAWAGLVWGLGINQAASQTPINYWDTLLFVLEKATLQRPEWPQGITWLGKLLGSLSVLLLPGQAALFILALRNRLGRRR